MDRTGYIILTIALVIALVIIFVVSFVLYVKTPVPKGCEKTVGPNCENCEESSCKFYHYAEEREAQKRAEKEKSLENKGEEK